MFTHLDKMSETKINKKSWKNFKLRLNVEVDFCVRQNIVVNLYFKVKSHGTALFVFSKSIKKLFSIDRVNIFLFSIFFFNRFYLWKKIFSIDSVNIYLFSIFFSMEFDFVSYPSATIPAGLFLYYTYFSYRKHVWLNIS